MKSSFTFLPFPMGTVAACSNACTLPVDLRTAVPAMPTAQDLDFVTSTEKQPGVTSRRHVGHGGLILCRHKRLVHRQHQPIFSLFQVFAYAVGKVEAERVEPRNPDVMTKATRPECETHSDIDSLKLPNGRCLAFRSWSEPTQFRDHDDGHGGLALSRMPTQDQMLKLI